MNSYTYFWLASNNAGGGGPLSAEKLKTVLGIIAILNVYLLVCYVRLLYKKYIKKEELYYSILELLTSEQENVIGVIVNTFALVVDGLILLFYAGSIVGNLF